MCKNRIIKRTKHNKNIKIRATNGLTMLNDLIQVCRYTFKIGQVDKIDNFAIYYDGIEFKDGKMDYQKLYSIIAFGEALRFASKALYGEDVML